MEESGQKIKLHLLKIVQLSLQKENRWGGSKNLGNTTDDIPFRESLCTLAHYRF